MYCCTPSSNVTAAIAAQTKSQNSYKKEKTLRIKWNKQLYEVQYLNSFDEAKDLSGQQLDSDRTCGHAGRLSDQLVALLCL